MTSNLDLAEQATHAVHDLNHRTRDPHAFTGPAQLYRLVGELGLLADGMPQLLNQLARWLQTERDAGRVRTDNQTDPDTVIGQATGYLARAGNAAHDLARQLNDTQPHLAHLGANDPPPVNGNHTRRVQDRADLAAGSETGWWDEDGRPTSLSADFFDDDGDWSTASGDDPPITLAPGEPPSSPDHRKGS